jgi:hypothetical protein
MTIEQAIFLNKVIDDIHGLFPIFSVFAILSLLSCFLPKKITHTSVVYKYFTWVQFLAIIYLILVMLSQSVTGGCLVVTLQSWIAQNYIGTQIWRQNGLFVGDSFGFLNSTQLRVIFFLQIPLAVWGAIIFWKKRLVFSSINSVSNSNIKLFA